VADRYAAADRSAVADRYAAVDCFAGTQCALADPSEEGDWNVVIRRAEVDRSVDSPDEVRVVTQDAAQAADSRRAAPVPTSAHQRAEVDRSVDSPVEVRVVTQDAAQAADSRRAAPVPTSAHRRAVVDRNVDFPDEVRVVTQDAVPSLDCLHVALVPSVERRRAALARNVEILCEARGVSRRGMDPCAVARGARARKSLARIRFQFFSARSRAQASSAPVGPLLPTAAPLHRAQHSAAHVSARSTVVSQQALTNHPAQAPMDRQTQASTNLAWMRSACWFAPARPAAALGP
jgi:hypothetical protein